MVKRICGTHLIGKSKPHIFNLSVSYINGTRLLGYVSSTRSGGAINKNKTTIRYTREILTTNGETLAPKFSIIGYENLDIP